MKNPFEVERALHPRAFAEWTPAEDRRLLKAIQPKTDRWSRHKRPDWIAISRRLGRSIIATQGRASLLRAAPRITNGLAPRRKETP